MTGIVLAGGRSTRFGEPTINKATATLDGRTFLERVVDTVAIATDRTPIVAVRTATQRADYEEVLAEFGVTFAFDSPTFQGPLAGIVGALEAVDTPWMFVCGCDMPLLSIDAIRWLSTQIRRDNDDTSPAGLVVRHSDGTPDPLHALYRPSVITDVLEVLPQHGGVRSLLRAVEEVETVPIAAASQDVPLCKSMININTRRELANATDRFAGRS